MTKYPVLRFISFLIRLVGWLQVVVGLLGILIIVAGYFGIRLDGISLPIFGPTSVGIFLSGLGFVAFGELIRVMVDIALNTARMAQASQPVIQHGHQ